MVELICHFQDYLSALSPKDKRDIMSQANVKVVQQLEQRESDRRYGRVDTNHYAHLVSELRSIFADNASSALSALVAVGPESAAARGLSGTSRELLYTLSEQQDELTSQIPSWALDPENFFLVYAEDDAVPVQSQISARFPCLVFANGVFDCLSGPDPEVRLTNLEDILQATGIYQIWQTGNLGQFGTVQVLDTGVSTEIGTALGVNKEAAPSLSPSDRDGHGSAVIEMIHALSPKATIESICVTETYSGGKMWNLVAGLTRLNSKKRSVVNLSIGVRPDWIASLGPEAASFRETITNLLRSLAALGHFPISATGNEGVPSLRWPAACSASLAVGSHGPGLERSSFSNYRVEATNMVLAPGGEKRQIDGKVYAYGRYGPGLTRDVYGTSFSTAVASALACLLEAYPWFQSMQVASRISLFRNHCRRNAEDFPILNVADIGAVWPI